MSMRCVVFSHGKESGPWGTKITALAEVARAAGWSVESVDYRGIDSAEGRLEALLAACRALPATSAPPVLAGSSLGGWLAAAASRSVAARGMFLMAPAFDMPGLPPLPPVADCPTVVVHGWQDDIVPVDHGLAFARAHRATLHLVDDDHRLTASLPRISRWFGEFLGSIPE
ncbi:MAG: alpha/beta hydrolase [Gammaproteobacteria bacterium]